MFMTCRLSNPDFSPELFTKTTVIDFTITQKGLEQQLLSRILTKEQKTVEDNINQLSADINSNKKQLQILNTNLLERLSNTEGSLLDDIELMEILNESRI